MSTLWHGRFSEGPSEALMAYSASLPFDQLLATEDIAGSRAHVRGLARAGLLTGDEADDVLAALDEVETELATGSFSFADSDEDIHTAVERRVTELAGDAGAKLHTGRSRNDQVATDLRLYARKAAAGAAEALLELAGVLVSRAEGAGEAYLPGYTHLQRAQPVLLAHHLLAHAWPLLRDVDRLCDAHRRVDVSPLGAGALAGSSLPLDPEATAADLGFAGVFENSLDAVSDRDFVAELCFALALAGVHLSRLGEEIVLWSSDEIGFCTLADAWATGSSMLPQKKNPDVAELARGKVGRVVGDLTSVLVTLKGLPLAYNRDLQEGTEPLFDAVEQVCAGAVTLAGLIDSAVFNVEEMAAAADTPAAAATDLAEILVADGVPFRQAHAIVGDIVARALRGEATIAELVAADERFDDSAVAVLAPGASVRRRITRGGAGPQPVAEQLARARQRLDEERGRVAELAR